MTLTIFDDLNHFWWPQRFFSFFEILWPETWHLRLGINDTFWLFTSRHVHVTIIYVESVKKMIQFSIQFKVELFNSKIYSIQNWTKIFIQRIIQIGKIISAWKNREKHAKWAVFSSKWAVFSPKCTFYSFFLWILHFFDSFKISFNSTAKIFIQKKYSFKKISDYSFNKNIHFLKKCRIAAPYVAVVYFWSPSVNQVIIVYRLKCSKPLSGMGWVGLLNWEHLCWEHTRC